MSAVRCSTFLFLLFLTLGLLTGCGSDNGAVTISTGSFDFGNVAVGTQVRRIAVTVKNTTTTAVAMSPKVTGSADFAIASDVSCGDSLGANGACSVVLVFTPSSSSTQRGTLDLGMASNNQAITLSGTGAQVTPGQTIVAATDNPLVALFTYTPQTSGDFSVEFGTDTNYGTTTSAIPATAGTPAMLYVAGMHANTTYHMRAVVTGGEVGGDQTFATTNFDANALPSLSAKTNGTPQPGIELMNPAQDLGAPTTYLQAYAVDLQGNLVWGYNYPDRTSDIIIQGIKPLPNGDMAVMIGLNSAVKGAPDAGEPIMVREINLAGVPVRQATLADINTQLSGLSLVDLHHDVTITPNGHWLLLGNALKSYNNLPGQSGSTDVLGDIVIDLDPNFNVAWTWNEFDKLDINRAPDNYPDWTHSNAILYSPTDGNFLVSSRHQNWLIKVDYQNGAGTGDVVWRLGNGGDFTLVGGTAPQDWFFGQHQPSFLSATTAGTFTITLMDNGFNRQLASGKCTIGTSCYSTVPVLQVDEAAKTATIVWRDSFDPSKFSLWGGGTTPLANGNLELDLCAIGNNSEVDEVTLTNPTTVVWSLTTNGQNLYRANRIPSLYPGVQW